MFDKITFKCIILANFAPQGNIMNKVCCYTKEEHQTYTYQIQISINTIKKNTIVHLNMQNS